MDNKYENKNKAENENNKEAEIKDNLVIENGSNVDANKISNINLNEQVKEETNGNLEKKIKNKIEIVLLIHKFEKELDEIIKKSLENQHEIMRLEKVLLFKKNWIDDFIGIYLSFSKNKNRSIDDLYNGIINKQGFLKEIKNKEESYISFSFLTHLIIFNISSTSFISYFCYYFIYYYCK